MTQSAAVEGMAPPPATVIPPPPSECDVCGGELLPEAEYATMSVVLDETPRSLRSARGSGFIEEEWSLTAVCRPCKEKFFTWLFGERLESPPDADTIPAPVSEGAPDLPPIPPSDPPPSGPEIEAFERPVPNHS